MDKKTELLPWWENPWQLCPSFMARDAAILLDTEKAEAGNVSTILQHAQRLPYSRAQQKSQELAAALLIQIWSLSSQQKSRCRLHCQYRRRLVQILSSRTLLNETIERRHEKCVRAQKDSFWCVCTEAYKETLWTGWSPRAVLRKQVSERPCYRNPSPAQGWELPSDHSVALIFHFCLKTLKSVSIATHLEMAASRWAKILPPFPCDVPFFSPNDQAQIIFPTKWMLENCLPLYIALTVMCNTEQGCKQCLL